MELSDVDLNQLVLFQRLIVERSVSKVAEGLGLTQPAVSNKLAKLRRLFGDELFVRTPAGMMPTPFAEQLAEPVGYALSMIHSGLNQYRAFDPTTVERAITVSMTDIDEIVFLPVLVDRLRREAPGISVNTVRSRSAANLRDDMEEGKVDLAIGPLPQLKAGFFQRRVFQHRHVCLFRKGNPIERMRFSLAEFNAAEHLTVVSEGTGYGVVDDLIRRAGIERKVRLTIPHFVSVGHILQRTDLVATVTERLAEDLTEPFGLTFRRLPFKLPEIVINVFWHAKVHRSPAHQWLRTVIFELFAEEAQTRTAKLK